ncbi:hypothetical protein HDE_04466 [Halotydeus destructor]|nr:hypothetical protein HDE_04466 [Halotydeus destructor]
MFSRVLRISSARTISVRHVSNHVKKSQVPKEQMGIPQDHIDKVDKAKTENRAEKLEKEMNKRSADKEDMLTTDEQRKFDEKKKEQIAEVHEAMQSTRDRDIEKMKHVGLLEPDADPREYSKREK